MPAQTQPTLRSYLRTLLVLGRVSNLPTVWSNCLAGWLLGGGGNWHLFTHVCLAATCLYVGGMFLNDAFDAEFDRRHRAERPIPSGAITPRQVWQFGCLWLGAGLLLLIVTNKTAASLGVVLLACILLYDAVHKFVQWAPVLMAACRYFLCLAAAATGDLGVTGLAMWSAFALAFYVAGLSFIARVESTGGMASRWPILLIVSPVGLSLVVNAGEFAFNAALLASLLLLWTLHSLGPLLSETRRNAGAAVSRMLAGIVFVDLLAVADAPVEIGAGFLVLFCLALLFQRFIPAT
ncbi:MAG: prenyltransferase [Verrucomicrobia bacterium]|nr:prenyltransferase [Verrucomicrobiota bacterium]